jgi:hypothetical protein
VKSSDAFGAKAVSRLHFDVLKENAPASGPVREIANQIAMKNQDA